MSILSINSIMGLGTADVLALLSVVMGGGLVASFTAVYRARPDRDSVIVSSAQTASEILERVNATLLSELTRTQQQLADCQARGRELERLQDLEDALNRRRSDRGLPEPPYRGRERRRPRDG